METNVLIFLPSGSMFLNSLDECFYEGSMNSALCSIACCCSVLLNLRLGVNTTAEATGTKALKSSARDGSDSCVESRDKVESSWPWSNREDTLSRKRLNLCRCGIRE
ncbi:hypothetical protein Bca4012_020646 [Brassica carinata]